MCDFQSPRDTFVADQRVTRGAVGNTQQRFGQAHQRHAFLAGQREFLDQALDAPPVRLPRSFFTRSVAMARILSRFGMRAWPSSSGTHSGSGRR